MPKNAELIDATNRAAALLGLPSLLLKAFIAIEGANVNDHDGVLQVTPSTRADIISRIPRSAKLAALSLDSSAGDSGISDSDLNARLSAGFSAGHVLVQVLVGGQYIAEHVQRFGGLVALAGLAYNAGPGAAQTEINTTWSGDPFHTALQYHKTIGSASDQVTVQPGITQIDPSDGKPWTRYPVTANDSSREIFQYQYLRQVPGRNFGLLDFIFRPTLMDAAGLFDNRSTDAPPGPDQPGQALSIRNGQFAVSDHPTPYPPGPNTAMFNTQPLSQIDPRWKNIPLGFPTAGQTIGGYGCTLSCLAMMANGFGYSETPATLNEKLKALGSGGFQESSVVWSGVHRVLPNIVLNGLVDCGNAPAPMSDIDAALTKGRPVIVEVDLSPAPGFQNHWVLIYTKQGNDYLIHDPAQPPGEQSASLTQRYGFAGAPAKIVAYVAFFDNPNFNPGQPPPPPAPLLLVVNSTPDIAQMGGLALRDQPTASGSTVKTRLPAGTVLTPVESADAVHQKIGVYNQWLNVRTTDGTTGWVAAWLVSLQTAPSDKALPTLPTLPTLPLPAKPRRRARMLDLETAVEPPLRHKVILRVKKGVKSATVRGRPRIGDVVVRVRGGAKFETLERREAVTRKLEGKRRGEWLKIVVDLKGKAGKQLGYVAGNLVELVPEPKSRKTRSAPNPSPRTTAPRNKRDKGLDLGAAPAQAPAQAPAPTIEADALPTLHVVAQSGLNLRDTPTTTGHVLTTLAFGTTLLLREPLATAQGKLGVADTWVAVATTSGVNGFVSGEFVALDGVPTAPGSIDPVIISQGCVLAAADAQLFANADGSGLSAWTVTAGTPLVLLNAGDWANLGNNNLFVKVRSYAFKEGYVRGSLLRAPDMADKRQRVIDDPLPVGISAWNYGLHDPFDRALFSGSNKRGWVLFTHKVDSGPGANYEDWSKNGWGVIVRLNNDYGGNGTIPTPDHYDAFAQSCQHWVSNSKGNIVWVIGNEMNNPREWPGSGQDPSKSITPELYAACFNKVRSAIKSVQQNAIVVPGAIDPFQGPAQSCLDYWRRMHAAITDLDGIALHCYTNGTTPDLVTSLKGFDSDPLRWQYYNFRAYTTFLDVMPPRFRTKYIFITETDAYAPRPWAGGQNGWVEAAYAEIDRWNLQPQAQQIQALMLYRWSRDDVFSIIDKPSVQADIRKTVNTADYRWRA